MARFIKMANASQPVVKMSSKEWLQVGLKSGLFYKDDSSIKIALTGAPSDNPVVGAGKLFDENQGKLKDPQWQAALGAYKSKRAPQGYSVVETSPGSGIFGLKNNATGALNMPGRGNQNLASMLNSVGRKAAAGGTVLPNPIPDGGGGGGGTTPAPVPAPAPSLTRGQILGRGAAALGGGLAGYYGTGAMLDAARGNNQMKDYRPQDFHRGIASLQMVFQPIAGISKVLDKEMRNIMGTIADLQNQLQQTQPASRGPSMRKQDQVAEALRNRYAPGSSAPDYLPK